MAVRCTRRRTVPLTSPTRPRRPKMGRGHRAASPPDRSTSQRSAPAEENMSGLLPVTSSTGGRWPGRQREQLGQRQRSAGPPVLRTLHLVELAGHTCPQHQSFKGRTYVVAQPTRRLARQRAHPEIPERRSPPTSGAPRPARGRGVPRRGGLARSRTGCGSQGRAAISALSERDLEVLHRLRPPAMVARGSQAS